MTVNLPQKFYKYTDSETTTKILESGKLRWSSPTLFNDLTEFQRIPIISPSIEDSFSDFIKTIVGYAYSEETIDITKITPQGNFIISFCKLAKEKGSSKSELIKELSSAIPYNPSPKFEDEIRKHVETWGNEFARVFCVTTDPKNEVMWAHYAENNSGCVLGFRHLPNLDTPLLAAKPIEYTSGYVAICSGLDFLLYGDNKDIRRKTFDAICFSKDIKWSYENEWRVVSWKHNETGKQSGDYKFYQDELESVTFGVKTPDSLKKKVTTIINAKYRNCSRYQMIAEKGEISRIEI